MNKTKRLLAALMAFVMLFSLGACGGKNGRDEESQKKGFAGANAVEGYVGIEAHNDEGEIIAAVDRTLFGSNGFSVQLREDNYKFFDGSIALGESLAKSSLWFSLEDLTFGAAYDGGFICADGDEYITADVASLLSTSESELDEFFMEFFGADTQEMLAYVEEEFGAEFDVDYEKLIGWIENIVSGVINEDVIADIFDTVAIPLAVGWANEEGINIRESDIPDFKTLKGILYDFFLDDYAADALDIRVDGNEYTVVVDLGKLGRYALDYLTDCDELQGLANNEFIAEVIDEAYDYLYECETYLDPIEFTVEIEDGYIKSVEIYDLKAIFSDYNSVDVSGDYHDLVSGTKGYELLIDIDELDDVMKM